jgi:glycosyltransferase involved in cell wall biosynthesis
MRLFPHDLWCRVNNLFGAWNTRLTAGPILKEMPYFVRIVLAIDWLIALPWLLRVLTWRYQLPRVPDLVRTSYAVPGQQLPLLSVIVPARNEAPHIAATLRSLLASQGIRLEIIAINDRSTDATGAVMDEVACEGSGPEKSIRALHVAELPQGWLGKTHAMALAASHATGDWLLFTDADVLFAPEALRRALEFALASEADHLVLLPTVVLSTWSERMMIAYLQVVSLWAVRPWRVPDPRARRDAIGVGAFNMIRREVYDALGGWETLRMEVLEDLSLGRRVKAQGFAQRVALGLDLVTVRWAKGAFGVVENLTKNLFALFHFRPELVLFFAGGFGVFALLPILAFAAGSAFWWPLGVLWVALLLAYHWTGKYHHFSAAQMPFYPLASLLLLYALLRSMSIALWRGGVTWRGTFYSLQELRKSMKEREYPGW